jgi:hypothetical protein
VRILDFLVRFAFFLVVPFLATIVAVLFPMTGVLVNIGLTLVVFAAAEAVRERAARSPLFARLVKRRLAFEEHYREHPPKPFLFYVFYPLLLPYVLFRLETRRELWLYRGFTGGGAVVLVALAGADYWRHWSPELSFTHFLGVWVLLFVIQTLALFVFLLPVSTTVVTLHRERRLTELWLLLGVAAISIGAAATRLILKRGHIVSWVTTHRVGLRTQADPAAARRAQLKALHAVLDNWAEMKASTDEGGWVEGDSGERAEAQLGLFYKPDEAHAFTLHAVPVNAPEVLALQCHLGRGKQPIWRALKRSGQEITSPTDLPAGVLGLQRRSTRRPGTKRGGAGLLKSR